MTKLNELVTKAEQGNANRKKGPDNSGQYMKNKTATIEWLVENGDNYSTVTEALVACPTSSRKTIKRILTTDDQDPTIIEQCLLHDAIDNKTIKKFVEDASPEMREQFSEAVTIRYAEAANLELDSASDPAPAPVEAESGDGSEDDDEE